MSFWRNYYHLVWETQERAALIRPSIEAELYTFIIDRAAESQVYVYAIGGIEDHIHLVAAIPPQLSVSQVVKDLKESSAAYINETIQPNYLELAWESGFGCLSFGEGQLPVAIAYVKEQSLHHAADDTNAWLERTDISDEGPFDSGLSEKIAAILRDDARAYLAEMGEPPF